MKMFYKDKEIIIVMSVFIVSYIWNTHVLLFHDESSFPKQELHDASYTTLQFMLHS